jgi:hypothetical protein
METKQITSVSNEKIVENVIVTPLRGLDRRLLMMLYAQSRWLSAGRIHRILLIAFRNGTVDRPYNYQWVCSKLRYLESLGLISKKESQGGWGRSSLYVINNYGIEQLSLNLGVALCKGKIISNSNNEVCM